MARLDELLKNGRAILDALHDGIVVADAAGTVVYVNDAHVRITGIPEEAALGRSVTDVVPDSSLPRVLETGEPLIGVKTRVGEHQVVSNIVPIIVDGTVIGGVSVFRDVTDVARLGKELARAHSHLHHLKRELKLSRGGEAGVVIGKNPAVQNVFRVALKAAQVTSTALIRGESGTGKEVLAHYIHENGPRSGSPFLTVNCAAIPEQLIESELFGYEEGAFTGARKGGRPGLFETADGGTVFLDEVGDMSLPLQAKLLRTLQSKEIKRVGGNRTITVDVRVLAATNKDLEDMIERGLFRRDLFYRLNVIPLTLPPLRQRREDLPLLVSAILGKIRASAGRPLECIAPDAMRILMAHDYPGNIRELENILEQAAVLAEKPVITAEDLPPGIGGCAAPLVTNSAGAGPPWPRIKDRELEALREALERFSTRTEAARALGISRATLYRKMAKYGVQ